MAELLVRTITVLALIYVPVRCFLLGTQWAELKPADVAGCFPALWRYGLAAKVILPFFVIAVLWIAHLPWEVATALLILCLAPPMTLATRRGMQVPDGGKLAIAWQFLSAALCIVSIPLLLLVADAILGNSVRITVLPIAKVVLFRILIPLVAGALVGRYWLRYLGPSRPFLAVLLNWAGRLLFALVLVVGAVPVWHVGLAGALCAVLISTIAIGVGHWLGAPPEGGRTILTNALALHRAAPAVALAHENGFVPTTIGVFLVFMAAGIVLLKLYGKWRGRVQDLEI